MRRLAWAFALVPLALLPAVGQDRRNPFLTGGGEPVAPPGNKYVAPKADGPVVVLLDEGVEPLFPTLINDGGGEPGTITREDRDVFAGVEAVRVTPVQKYRTRIPGWEFKIVEKPAAAGEFRHLRFAWKKVGGVGVMIQFHDPAKSWAFRYFAGQNAVGWNPAKPVSDKIPVEWELVTRDLFQEFGTFTITGVALTAMYGDGDSALFDHVLLGRTVADLDKATEAALGRVKGAKPQAGKERDGLWDDLMGADAKKASAALRAFLATAPDHVVFVKDRLAKPGDEQAARIRELIAKLDADDFDTRDAATDALVKIGPAAVEAVRPLVKGGPNDEVRFRAAVILKRLGGGPAPGVADTAARLTRVVRVLERAGTADARAVLREIADGKLAHGVAPEAKAALARLAAAP